jgi:carbon-monoxide dehydrogenase medium subunit
MAIVHDFDYVRSTSIEDAITALTSAGPSARVLAGGTDIVPWLRDDLIEPALLVDIKQIPGLDGIARRGEHLELGALVTFSDLITSPIIHDTAPMLTEMAHQVASTGVRNRATIVGNLCSAVPSLDAGPALLVYETILHVVGPAGERTVSLDDWIVGPKSTRLGPGEIVTDLSLVLPPGHAGVFAKLARYEGEDLAQANLAIVVTTDLEYRVAFGAVAPRPFRAKSIETLLDGRELDGELIAAARALVDDEISPISDVRASAEYRSHMCRVMLGRGLETAAARLSGGGPPHPARII